MISKVRPLVSDTGEEKEWYETWFNSPYYHILYKERNEKEAEDFLDNLINKTGIKPGSKILDVACGKGRHSIYLNKKGFDVSAYDLSEQSIEYDLQYENETLHFYLHDMREMFRVNYFDIVLNIFSSFGYFNTDHDNYRCLLSHASALKKGGLLILDYFNTDKIRAAGDHKLHKEVDGIIFNIEKKIKGKIISKNISFTDAGKNYSFQENVILYNKDDFENYFLQLGLEVVSVYGNYQLEKFDAAASDRMIFIAEKK